MKSAVLVVNSSLLGNKPFYKDDPITNRDDCMYHYWLLKEKLKLHDIDLVTQDLCPGTPEFYIFDDLPKESTLGLIPDKYKFGLNPDIPQYLLLWECEMIQGVWPPLDLAPFEKVFSWFHWWDHPKAIRVYWPQKIKKMYRGPKSKFLCIVSNHKFSYHYRELYSERLKAISYFEDKIDVYGNTYQQNSKIIPNKYEVIKDYRFSICYENARDIPGYTTEKLFDCFKAGVVPIYIGDASEVPKNCYIDKNDFKSYKELEEFLQNMTDKEYRKYLDAIEAYLPNTKYNAEIWVNTIINNVINKK